MKQPNHTLEYAQMGMAALLPGMVHMLELMQRQVDDFRERLTALQGQDATEKGKRKVGRPVGARGRSGWPEDPEERALEMKRRMAKWKTKQPQKESALSKQRKKDWAALSPAKRKKRLAAMLAGRRAKLAPVVLEQAS